MIFVGVQQRESTVVYSASIFNPHEDKVSPEALPRLQGQEGGKSQNEKTHIIILLFIH